MYTHVRSAPRCLARSDLGGGLAKVIPGARILTKRPSSRSLSRFVSLQVECSRAVAGVSIFCDFAANPPGLSLAKASL